ncbi:DUF3833 domain-containing protein [Rhizobiaceae bacterium n13]|uniref:DUF3833 domain-containing protein n=1 Tax=Ferirhizobium litorale TaxID=2927786 RepID=A0AAE3U299_9HYPH|nr:DUF3833 family protein [Fererhizobium litorale]MDI7862628.1 DUF3833 domain-containing protein [Fererhizobium litorale]MDI7923889.1 DUF3833 domain-containing protein [Fererhizobium litorale]
MRVLAVFAVAMAMTMSFIPATVAAGEFTLESFFAGKTQAQGSFSAINGVRRSFAVDLVGRWDGKTLKLREDFVFDDGTRDRKTWRFVKTGPSSYRGTREDVIGETNVRLSGNVARFTYVVYLDPARKKNKVRFHDTMTLRPDGTVLNNALVTKFGLPVAITRVEFARR